MYAGAGVFPDIMKPLSKRKLKRIERKYKIKEAWNRYLGGYTSKRWLAEDGVGKLCTEEFSELISLSLLLYQRPRRSTYSQPAGCMYEFISGRASCRRAFPV